MRRYLSRPGTHAMVRCTAAGVASVSGSEVYSYARKGSVTALLSVAAHLVHRQRNGLFGHVRIVCPSMLCIRQPASDY